MRHCLISRSLKWLWWLFKAHERSLIWNYCILILLIQKHSPVTPSNSRFASKISNKGHPLNKVHTTCMWGTLICFINHVLLILRAYQSCIQSLLVFLTAIMFTTAVLFYMVGLDSPTVQDICGASSVFHTADCHIGWSYLLLVICSAVCFLLPVLSHYIDYRHLCANHSSPNNKRSPPREYEV